MSFVSSSRRYRPQKFHEVLGQGSTVRILQNAIKFDRIANAYLFSGQRGTGKTSLARLIAKSLNCDDLSRQIRSKVDQVEPCDSCPSCTNIREGKDAEVLELDAASNRGIDEAKELQKVAQHQAKSGKWRIIILDECHMLTREAQNALLALFESPPPFFLPILCTTDADKVLATIVSRCMHFQIRPLDMLSIQQNLQRIFEDAKQPISESVVRAIARSARGSLRDVQQVADQVINSAFGETIDDEFFERLTGIPSLSMFRRVAGALTTAWQDGPRTWFEEMEDLWNAGADFNILFFQVISTLLRDFRIAVISKGLPEPVVPYWSDIPHQMFEEHCAFTHYDLDLMTQSWDDASKDFYKSVSFSNRHSVEFWFLRSWDAKQAKSTM